MASASGANGSDDDAFMGCVREAMAFRVKYRLADEQRAKRRLHLEMLCVSKQNRAGQYPMPLTVANLGIGIFQDGFDPEEANHEGVCVQEVPAEHRPEDWETSLRVNQKKTAGTALEGCFPPDSPACYGTLAHSHLLLSLLCWLYGLKWDIPDNPRFSEKWQLVLSGKGHLCKDAVASVDPLLAKALTEGLFFEILSWKMLIEEPTAASKISQALNKGQARALRTTELIAISVLSGAVMLHQIDILHRARFETVREKVRGELDIYVDEPEFIEFFDFVIRQCLGVSQNHFLLGCS